MLSENTTSVYDGLKKLDIPPLDLELGRDLDVWIDASWDRIDAYQESIGEQLSPAFEPAEYRDLAEVLIWLRNTRFPQGARFCEWGCGFGVVAGIAALLGFKAWGVENDRVLLQQAEELRQLFGLETRLIEDDFFTCSDPAPAHFDLVYAYPWPGEVKKFARHALGHCAPGACYLTYLGFNEIELAQIPAE